MLKDVTLGRYYPATSSLHALDPRTKLFGLLVFILSTFLFSDPVGLILVFLVFCGIVKLSEVPVKHMVKGLRGVAFIIIFTDLYSVFFVENGVWKALVVTLRMVEIVFASNCLSLTTRPREIAQGLEKAMGGLEKIKVPVHDIATVVMIAFRFIPILTDEADRIMDAQKSRGADFESGKFLERAKAIVPILVPLFVSAFRRSDELSDAMDARCYGVGKATSLHPLEYGAGDQKAYSVIALYLLIVLFWRFQPWL